MNLGRRGMPMTSLRVQHLVVAPPFLSIVSIDKLALNLRDQWHVPSSHVDELSGGRVVIR